MCSIRYCLGKRRKCLLAVFIQQRLKINQIKDLLSVNTGSNIISIIIYHCDMRAIQRKVLNNKNNVHISCSQWRI